MSLLSSIYRNATTAAALSCSAALICTLKSLPVTATESGIPVNTRANISLGGRYDSNISVEELGDIVIGNDVAATVSGSIDAVFTLSQKHKLSTSYDFEQSIYQTFTQVNTQTHIGGVQWDMSVKPASIGASFHHVLAKLDNSSFLKSSRLSAFTSGFLTKRWFMRGAYVFNNRDIVDREERAAQSHTGEVDMYFFQQGLRRYINVGYRFKSENARDSNRDYDSQDIKLRIIQRLALWKWPIKIELSARFEERKYRATTLWLNNTRNDKRLRLRTVFDINFNTHTTLSFYYSHNDYKSSLALFTYDQSSIGTKIRYQW